MDDQLRALERAARAAPDDRAAGWARVRALERAGDEVGAWRETCRLARAGDDDAWAELERRPRGAGSPGTTVERRFPSPVEVVSAGPDELLVLSGGALQALDPRTFEPRWSAPAVAPVCAAGPYVAHVARVERLGGGRDLAPPLVLRDRRSGAEVARRSPPTGARSRRAEVWWLGATADRLVACGFDEGGASQVGLQVTLSLTDGLELLHQARGPGPGSARRARAASRGLVLASTPNAPGRPPARTVAVALDGTARWQADGTLEGIDARGALIETAAPGGGAGGTLRELELVSGETRWGLDPGAAVAHLGPSFVLLEEAPHRRGGETVIRLSTRDRTDGRPGWEQALLGPARTALGGVALAADVVYALLVLPVGRGPRGALHVIEARSGLTRWTAPLDVHGGSGVRVHDVVELVPVDDGLVVHERDSPGGGGSVLHRLGAPRAAR